jgi:hypothetical protein
LINILFLTVQVNEGLKAPYARQGHTELKTLQQWNAAGKRTGKGESALLLRAKPKKINTHNPSDRTGHSRRRERNGLFPGMVCIFQPAVTGGLSMEKLLKICNLPQGAKYVPGINLKGLYLKDSGFSS